MRMIDTQETWSAKELADINRYSKRFWEQRMRTGELKSFGRNPRVTTPEAFKEFINKQMEEANVYRI